MKQGQENFEFVKEEGKEHQRNYLFKKDSITKGSFFFIVIILALLVLAVIFVPKLMT